MSSRPKQPGSTPLPSVTTTAYAVVPTSDRDGEPKSVNAVLHHVTATPAMVRFDGVDDDDQSSAPFYSYQDPRDSSGKDLFCDRPFRTVDPNLYGHMPEARGLAWQDGFFDDDPEFRCGCDDGTSPSPSSPPSSIVAVFDFDYDLMESYWEKVSWTSLGAALLLLPHLAWIALLGMAPCYVRRNVRWAVRSQHVAVTTDGIAYVRERRPTCWGQPCTDSGRTTQTISFDHITDCSIVEPAGNTCLWIPNTLRTVHVDTTSGGGTTSDGNNRRHELTLTGLKDPIAFKRLVWAMKRNYHRHHGAASTSIAERGATAGNGCLSDSTAAVDPPLVAELLREIRDELRRSNNASNGEAAAPSSQLDEVGDSPLPLVQGRPLT